jgi:hypothetical protein
MKKLIILSVVALLATGSSVKAQQDLVKNYASCINSFKTPFDKIVVEDDIDLVLYEQTTPQVMIDGNDNNSSKVKWTIKGSTLHISSSNGSLKGKVLVTVAVNQLTDITVLGNSSVRSLGSLKSPSIQVNMSGDGMVSIQSEGRIYVHNTEGIELDVKKSIGLVKVYAR